MTYQECLNVLTKEQQKLFEKNMKDNRDNIEEYCNLFKSYEFYNFYEFLATAFVWSETAEEHEFWSDIAHSRNTENQEK